MYPVNPCPPHSTEILRRRRAGARVGTMLSASHGNLYAGPPLIDKVCPRSLQTMAATTRPGLNPHTYRCARLTCLSPQVADPDAAVELQTDKALADVIMDSELDKWTPGQECR